MDEVAGKDSRELKSERNKPELQDVINGQLKKGKVRIFTHPGPSCSKLTTLLVNDSLKFTSSDTQICWNFSLKNVSSFCIAKATHIFSAKNIRILYIESTKTVNEMTLNELVKLTTLWTTGPKSLFRYNFSDHISPVICPSVYLCVHWYFKWCVIENRRSNLNIIW